MNRCIHEIMEIKWCSRAAMWIIATSSYWLGGALSACIPAPSESRLLQQVERADQNGEAGQEATEGAGQEAGEEIGEVSSEETSGETSGAESSLDSCEPDGRPERTWIGVITEIKFGREDPAGVSLGRNIDGRVSRADDAQGCFRSDMTSPDGEEGIDNQFAKILPLVEAVGGEAIEGLVQGIINQGRLLLMFELGALDDPLLRDDDCMQFDFFYGLGVPRVNARGSIITGQTFDRDFERPSVSVTDVPLEHGTFEVSGLEFQLPIVVFEESYMLDLSRVTIHGEFSPEGELMGYLSGVIDVDAVAERVEMIEGGGMVAEVVPGFLRQQADLDPDDEGVCRSLSVTLTLRAKRAHLFMEE